MDKRESSRVEAKLKTALDEQAMTDLGISSGMTVRLRVVTPFRLALVVIGALATKRVETLADIERLFTAWTGLPISYKPFHNQLSKEGFSEFMRLVLCRLLGHLVQRALEPVPGSPLEMFDDIVLQDGSSFAVMDELAEMFPGRFTKHSPAAIEVHATMSLKEDRIVRVSLAADSQGERDFLPEPKSLLRKLFLADRGYEDRDYFARVHGAGGHFVVRCKGNANPMVEQCWLRGERVRQFAGRRLKEFRKSLHGGDADLTVVVARPGGPFRYRMVLIWNPAFKEHMVLATNLDAARFGARAVRELYALRWQVELAFKEWKSYANLHKFQTGKASIVKGLVWGAVAASLLKRFLAHAAQAVHGVPTSTRKVAMAIPDHLRDLLCAMLARTGVGTALTLLLAFLASKAKRANPKRDKSSGRLSPGLMPAFTGSGFAT